MPNRFIDPTLAAHNIATAYCKIYLESERTLGRDLLDNYAGNSDMISHVTNTSKIYANIYDAVFEEISKQNELD